MDADASWNAALASVSSHSSRVRMLPGVTAVGTIAVAGVDVAAMLAIEAMDWRDVLWTT
jgi:phosphoribosylcarboxyaminoimidazole (NCAIR) mutase